MLNQFRQMFIKNNDVERKSSHIREDYKERTSSLWCWVTDSFVYIIVWLGCFKRLVLIYRSHAITKTDQPTEAAVDQQLLCSQ